MRSRRGRWLWLGVGGALLLLLVVVGWLALRGRAVPSVTVSRGPLVQRVVVSGRVTPPAQIQIGTLLAGTVRAVHVDEGDVVEAGTPLVDLDAAELDASVAQADAAVRQAKARLAQLFQVSAPSQAEAVRQAELSLAQAERQFERTERLAKAGSVAEADLEEARVALDLARSRVTNARTQAASVGRSGAELRAAEANVVQAEAQLLAAKARRAQATLQAPTRVQVLLRGVEPGDAVSPGRTLLTLARIGATRLSIEPDEKNLAFIRKGQPAVASADAFPDQRFEAEVESVAPSVNPERGTVEVKLRVPEPPEYLRPEMTVSVDIEVARRDDAIVLPVEAVREAAGTTPWVLVAEDGRAVRKDVRLGITGGDRVEVVEGLAPGARVLVPDKPLQPGGRVRAVALEPPSEG